ncbi:hypothetical protein K435DRAFT_851123 [Dendrothele bispora CBS 962.96]|uniref:Uncharacterized protein n=1 Tax=Dendrothele bispora (strain CBS 962.96) TaxID=1314807 RepID=A0A4S8MMK7_DENBC|nr:hypothetical protein K435DRAFT_851123 [Dendrothele bispora CBS 962.96]
MVRNKRNTAATEPTSPTPLPRGRGGRGGRGSRSGHATTAQAGSSQNPPPFVEAFSRPSTPPLTRQEFPDYTTPPHSPSSPSLDERLHAVAVPSLLSPRAGPHSINRAPSRQSQSQPRSSQSSMASDDPFSRQPPPPSTSETNASQDSNHRGSTKDCYEFYSDEGDSVHRRCKFCLLTDPQKATTRGRFKFTTASGQLRKHLYDTHLGPWVDACDHLGYPITAKSALIKANAYRQQQGRSTQTSTSENLNGSRCAFSSEAFLDAICEWIVGDSQSINGIESPRLRKIFLMLREELKDEDIPHRTHI